ncbi:hypothetical protein [Pseudobacteriovorax antillogorgiicola]|uniref:Plasmid segregation protein ParM n=1 Tax=Pseudobacteriovorax antillogorgiicola TaxID=1513793 RepID=A0A1Y6BZG0_9BACT|nr:hypothetical protein [Pseudobacteriovorax antillogorgiicola]TCS53092.1 hypothetical protein EDD56_108143 [Pseudobacteriovorax antillogorgiicola]SMF26021.1 hypothetical protein SAMN06296036_108104 [Pseudobacteriovorax antillogorgiicola]
MNATTLKSLPAFITKEPRSFSESLMANSISIKDQGIWLTVGEAAQMVAPDHSRAFGGNLRQPNFRRLVKAAIAYTLGAGRHKLDLALAASQQHFSGFTDASNKFDREQRSILEEIVRDIEFRTHPLEETQHCQLELENVHLLYETQAVLQAVPRDLRSYILWQLGHGDLQQITMYDGRPIPNTHARVEGLSSAIRDFAQYVKLPLADAVIAWQNGQKARSDSLESETSDIFEEKQRAIREYFATATQDLLNLNEPYKQRSVAIVLSGGGAKDPMVVDCLRQEIESGGHYKLFAIDQLPHSTPELQDPVFTCVQGLLKTASLALDIGNSSLKTGFVSRETDEPYRQPMMQDNLFGQVSSTGMA